MKNIFKIIPIFLILIVLPSCFNNIGKYEQQDKCIFTEYEKWAIVSDYDFDKGYVVCDNAASPCIYTFYDSYFSVGYSESDLMPDSIESAQSFDVISYMQIEYDEKIWTANKFDGVVLKTVNDGIELLLVPYEYIDMSIDPVRNDNGTYNYFMK